VHATSRDEFDSLESLEAQLAAHAPAQGTRAAADQVYSKRHIVAENFEYVERPQQQQDVVDAMLLRQALRKKTSTPGDKMRNPLITIPGSPGIGKSSFLANFALMPQFKEYVQDRAAIISMFTFNSEMDEPPDALGLRIIFGAIRSMGLHDPAVPPEWEAFVKRHRHHHDLDAVEALRLLFRVLGEDRPMLLLVDELRIAKDDKEVITQLGRVLNRFGNVDVLVSALSPKYIADLVTPNSQRPITYILLPPLLDADLCRKECSAWADRLIAATKKKRITN
jgi:hypothetical protein